MSSFRNLLSLFVLNVSTLFLGAQTVYPFPARVPVERIEVSMPNSNRNEEMPMSLLQDYTQSFHPIGWSADGKAAYLVWGELDASSTFGVVVYDAANDSVAGKWFENMGDNRFLEQDQIEAFWQRDKDSIVPLLERFKIIPEEKAAYADFPAHFDGTEYTIEYSLHTSDKSEYYYDQITGTFVVVNNQTVNRTGFSWNGYFDFNIQPAGLWMSPDRKFAITVIAMESPGLHESGHPHSVWYEFKSFDL